MVNSQTTKNASQRHKTVMWIVAGACAVLLGMAAIVFVARTNSNQVSDLGAGMEYIGQDQLRCYFWGLMCDSGAYKVYYFATNMSEEQLEKYFKNGSYIGRDLGTQGADFTSDGLLFQNKDGQKFIIQYYHNVQPSKINNGLKRTDKPYGLSMTDSNYVAAKLAL